MTDPLKKTRKTGSASNVTEVVADRQADPFALVANIRERVRQIPKGKVSTYGAVAAAAGYPRAPRMVAKALVDGLVPWHRVLGAGGRISLKGEAAFEQRFRLEAEGVKFKGRKVDMAAHEHRFRA